MYVYVFKHGFKKINGTRMHFENDNKDVILNNDAAYLTSKIKSGHMNSFTLETS